MEATEESSPGHGGALWAPPSAPPSGGWAAMAAKSATKEVRVERPMGCEEVTACISMHQPWASLLVYGIKTVEGRSWPTTHRGTLWVAATAQEVSDCISHAQYELHVPEHLREENGSEYLFMCQHPMRLLSPVRVKGRHKIWDLDRPVVRAAAMGLEAPPVSLLALCAGEAGAGEGEEEPAGEMAPIRWLMDYKGDQGVAMVIQTLSLEKAMRPSAGKCLTLLPGLVLVKGFLSKDQQAKVAAIVEAVSDGQGEEGGFERVKTAGGSAMHLDMLQMGRYWQHGQGYSVQAPGGSPPPRIPPELAALARDAAAEARPLPSLLPREPSPRAGGPGRRLAPRWLPPGPLPRELLLRGRQARHASRQGRKRPCAAGGAPSSVDIGGRRMRLHLCTRAQEDSQQEFPGEKSVRLESGDLLVFGGPARLIYHGVRKVHSNSRPKGLLMRPGRLNLTFRQYGLG